jgi:hypothetical protein
LSSNRGAYGLEVVGAGGAAPQLVAAAPDWPKLEIERLIGTGSLRRTLVGADRAEIALMAGDELTLDRVPLRATFTTAGPLTDEALVHPYLAPAAAIAGHWLGREAFHGGAFVLDGGAWAILGDKESGKSSLLASLAQNGLGIVADDALIVERELVFAGPRSIDLREEPAQELDAGESIGLVGDRKRWRMSLAPVAPATPLRGWVFLSWSEPPKMTPLPAGQRLQRLLVHRMIKGLPPADPARILELATLPAFQLGLPRRWSQLEAARSLLIATLGTC